MGVLRRDVYFNDGWQSWHAPNDPSLEALEDIHRFHTSLSDYTPTPLIKMNDLANEIGVRAIHLKDESARLGLPSFKILGASSGTFRTIVTRLDLPLDSTLDAVKQALEDSQANISLHAATDGNHGRTVARVGQWLGLPVEIHVPSGMHAATIQLIESEGARVVRSTGSYDDAVLEAQKSSHQQDGIIIQDFAFAAYQDILQWIVDGYNTMLREIEEQLEGQIATHVFAPAGVGSFAQALTTHFRPNDSSTSIIGVEPDVAACLWKSLKAGHPTAINTVHTIVAGLDCGTVSSTAWPILSEGFRASLTVSDFEARSASVYLESQGLSVGPCGASTAAALIRLSAGDKVRLGINSNSVIVLPCTEGAREYDPPLDVSIDGAVALTQTLVQINSSNPSMGSIPGPGETAIANYIASWLEHRDLENHRIEPTKGRPSIVGISRGTGGGKSLLFNGHIDTVTLVGYEGDPVSGQIENGKLYGRSAAEMKCGVAAAMVALANSKRLNLRGDVIFAGVADEEDLSIGIEDILKAGWRADGAIVNETTDLCVVDSHKGFVWLEADIHGVASHGSRADLGVDAIAKAGHFLAELDRYAQRLRSSTPESSVGHPTIHASLIKGGEEASSYPANCSITLERRTIAGETAHSIEQEIREMLEGIQNQVDGFGFSLRVTASRPALDKPEDSSFCELVCEEVGTAMGKPPIVKAEPYWTDCALLAAEGIPALIWGPIGEGLHAKE